LERARIQPVAICRGCGVAATDASPVVCTVCGAKEFEAVSREMIERIAKVEGGLSEEVTYDGRKLRWSDEAKRALWSMKDAYQRRRTKARVEKGARMRRLDIVTLEFAKALIEEETGKPLELPTRLAAEALKDDAATAAHAATAGANGQGNGAAAEKRLIARDANKNPLLSVYDWTPEAIERVLRVPAGFMRNMTQERIEALAKERQAAGIDLPLVEAGIELGKTMMAEMIANYPRPGAPATAAQPAAAPAPALGSEARPAVPMSPASPEGGRGYLNEVRTLSSAPRRNTSE
ncbi:MAG TPA: PCP reductase family protein, partial [Candidatus Polarisedimenticolia bacterium]|nr:PCP reductase family protein [Candidatus Polarisedimenticolia bacterium]